MSAESTLLSKALAVVAADPDLGPVRHHGRTIAEVVRGESTDRRQVRITDADGRAIVLVRFPVQDQVPTGYPRDIPFVGGATVWAGAGPTFAAAAWCNSGDTADLAARIVTLSVGSDWELDSSAALKFPKVTSVTLTKPERRRSVMLISGVVGLIDVPVGSSF